MEAEAEKRGRRKEEEGRGGEEAGRQDRARRQGEDDGATLIVINKWRVESTNVRSLEFGDF